MNCIAKPLFVLLGLSACTVLGPTESTAGEYDTFERKVRPLLVEHCYECHSAQAKTLHGGLRLDTAEDVRRGGDSGEVVVAGKPDESLLIETLRYDGDIQMPPAGKLSPADLATLTRWVQRGAAFPPSEQTEQAHRGAIDFDEGKRFWSFQPAVRQPLPDVSGSDWPQTRLDRFLLAAMQQHGLTPAPQADRTTLIRRLCFDVTGLPPTPAMVRDFVDDASPDAYRRLVDRLLESPQYGEKWGRWWLDMARYTDRTASWLYQTGQSHFYRDWVVGALNRDMPYDEFVRRQLATDLMTETGPRDLPALGFISLSPTYWKELKLPCEIIKVIVADEWEERVDAVSRTFLGLTVACARCHDHKFDPISTEDYYALAGVFASCRQVERPLVSEAEYEPVRVARQQVESLEAELAKRKGENPLPSEKIAELENRIDSIKRSTPQYDMPMANALAEESMFVVRAGKTPQEGTKLEYRNQPRDLPAFIRGNPNRPGPIVPRRFLTVLAKNPQPYQNGSGRLELADSIFTDAAPLAARVIVNRIWMAHFGQGLVDTPSNFGTQGGRPTHPELLDDLAARFIESAWSMKQLHRQILLSAAWQQSSLADQDSLDRDPENRWLSRMNQRRLNFEEWRDLMLTASGELSLDMGGPSIDLDAANNHRRTLYATVHRRDMSPTLMVHDFPDPTQHSPKRTPTITALQGLFALNGPLLLKQSQSVAEKLDHRAPGDHLTQIEQLYWRLFSRSPSDQEIQIGRTFLRAPHADEPITRLQQYVHALLASNEAMFVD
ncbi:Planctomycete cytochrome C [Stieleria maiorica]|uniref:Planctomycete cytochrome C n=1 Tax=Stieleria maiorica TaxID=2795974 RepID=A0A5B9MGK3_9BACT|nr:PSD1 and planctomycete cytochrome C domain-containing protein [Stieleria maiorica]QEG00403.1 Planctomycete cytochrome C [Stieleria maiorica]